MNSAGIPSIAEVVNEHIADPATPPPESLIHALMRREDALAEAMGMAGMQFGLFPQIVAEVFAELEFGHPRSDEERLMIRRQFEQLMIEIQNQQPPQG